MHTLLNTNHTFIWAESEKKKKPEMDILTMQCTFTFKPLLIKSMVYNVLFRACGRKKKCMQIYVAYNQKQMIATQI